MDRINYNVILETHQRALKKIELDLSFFLKDVGNLNIYNIESRVKTFESSRNKSKKINVEIRNLDDLVGLRIIVGTHSEIPIIERFFTRQEYVKDLVILKKNEYQRNSGYRALHIIVELKSHYLRSVYPGRVEVQIQTIFSNAFNFLSRKWSYKSNLAMDKQWSSKFLKLSDVLNDLEKKADELHSEVINRSSFDETSIMTPLTMIVITKQEFGEDLNYEDATDYCGMYFDIGYRTNGQLRAFFQNKDVEELYSLVLLKLEKNKILEILISMGRSGFWQMFGTKIKLPSTKKFLFSLFEIDT